MVLKQIFALRMVVGEYLRKGRKMYVAFMDLEKAYDRVDRKVLWRILRGRAATYRNKGLFRGTSAYLNRELSDGFDIGVGVRQDGVMPPCIFIEVACGL